jgi:MFS family permease
MLSSATPSQARWAVAAIFFLHGLVWGSWVPHIPLAKERLDVGTGVFGLALLAMAGGAVVAMPIAGALINRFGSAPMTVISTIFFSVALILPAIAPTLPLFMLAAFAYGATIGSMDVSMNAHGLAVEHAMKSPVMSFFHGTFSVGGMAGALVGAALLIYLPPLAHVALASAIGLAGIAWAGSRLLPASVDKGLSGESFAWPTRATIWLGLLCFLTLMAEGSVIDWAAIMLRDRFVIEANTAALGYGLFSAGMAFSRFTGDWLRLKFGAVPLVRLSALLTAVGMAGAVSMPDPALAIAAFAVAGIGLGNIAPVLFAGGGRLEPDAPGRGIAAVTTLGYTGFLAGPPLIGFTAELTGLPVALGLTVIAALIIAVAARAVHAADTY